MKHKNAQHQLLTIAQHEMWKIQYCDCGAVTLHLGPFSIRLTESAFRQLAASADDALQAIQILKGQAPSGVPMPIARQCHAG